MDIRYWHHDATDPVLKDVMQAIARAADEALGYFDQRDSPARERRRINEVSGLVEKVMLER